MKKDGRAQVPYLKGLLFLMIGVDKKEGRKGVVQPEANAIRSLFTIVPAHTNKAATALKVEQIQEATKTSAPKDDEILLLLAGRFIGKIW